MTDLNTRCLIIGLSMLSIACSAKSSFAQVDLDEMNFDIDKTYLVKLNDGKRYAGRVLSQNVGIKVVRRNGRINFVSESKIKSIDKVADEFEPKTFQQIRVELQNEFGARYMVSQTAHFLVVHPPGKYEDWAWPMEQVYMRFQTYCKSRGIETSDPEFPLIAVILRTKREFQRIAHNKSSKSAAGYYSLRSNRCFTYQQDYAWMSEAERRVSTFETLMHEAAHQIGYNTGIHNRLGRNSSNDRWYGEGLATMFEAKGINDIMKYPNLDDRINWDSLDTYRKFRSSGRSEGAVERLIHPFGEFFDEDVYNAYASAWALTFYLTERRPREYASFVKLVNTKPSGRSEYFDPESYFVQAFGRADAMEAEMNAFIDSLPKKK